MTTPNGFVEESAGIGFNMRPLIRPIIFRCRSSGWQFQTDSERVGNGSPPLFKQARLSIVYRLLKQASPPVFLYLDITANSAPQCISWVPLPVMSAAIVEMRNSDVLVAGPCFIPIPFRGNTVFNRFSELLNVPLVPYTEWLKKLEDQFGGTEL